MTLTKRIALAATAMLLASTTSYAGVNLIVQQVGSDVVITGGGSLDKSLWTPSLTSFALDPSLSDESLIVGASALVDTYNTPAGFNGPALVTTSPPPNPTSGTGPIFGIESSGALVVPAGFTGLPLGFSSATFANTQIADLTLASDKLHWDWDGSTGGKDFFNIVVNNGPNPSNITYQIISDPGLPDGYGFSGTITTDGTLGDFNHGDALPIIDWNITLTTPDGSDGVAERTLTGLNSYLRTNSGDELVSFTATEMIVQNPGLAEDSSLMFYNTEDGNFEWLKFSAGNFFEDFHSVSVVDGSEAIDRGDYGEQVSGGFVIANVVPEPSSLSLLALGGLVIARRRR